MPGTLLGQSEMQIEVVIEVPGIEKIEILE